MMSAVAARLSRQPGIHEQAAASSYASVCQSQKNIILYYHTSYHTILMLSINYTSNYRSLWLHPLYYNMYHYVIDMLYSG